MILCITLMEESNDRRGLVHLYTGEGKGKTTAALGVALRAIGWGLRACVIQFIKGYPDIGEARFAQEFPERLTLKQFAIDLSRGIDERKVVQRRSEAEAAMLFAEEAMAGGDFDLIILDEINNALHYGLIDVSRLLTFIRTKPEHMEVILTGRSAPQEIIEAADYVTELRLVKHPYEQGVQARKGVDY